MSKLTREAAHAPVVDAALDVAASATGMGTTFLGRFHDADYEFLRVHGGLPGIAEGQLQPRATWLCDAMLAGGPSATADAHEEPAYRSLPVVTQPGGVTSYVGASLVLDDAVVGTLCGVDSRSIACEPAQVQVLRAVTELVASVVAAGDDAAVTLRRVAAGWRVQGHEGLDLTGAMVLADLLAADLPLPQRPPRPPGELVSETDRLRLAVLQLEHALSARVQVEQAIGVLTERHAETPRTAFERLRKAARSRGLRVHDLAALVVASATDDSVALPRELSRP